MTEATVDAAGGSSEGVRSTCPYCGVGCGVVAARQSDGTLRISGDGAHPANRGRLCSKGAALAETVDLDGRLLHPVVDGRQVSWDAALDAVAQRFARIIEQHGPDAVAFYVSGQLLTEDYYVANKLMKGFIGSANIDTNSRLCMSSAVAAYKRAFGSDTVPTCYEDLELADLVVVVGSNLAWCHPVLYQRLVMARRARSDCRVVVIDPRRTATCDIADLHLAVRSGSDGVLFTGLLRWLQQHGFADRTFVDAHTEGVDEALAKAALSAPSVDSVATLCGCDVDDVHAFFALFGANQRVVTLFSQGINQSSSGTDKGNAIINCHLLTGRIGQPGCGPFSITGQPNAMGGREVGGLANQLAAHMDLDRSEDRDRVARFWRSPGIPERPGLKAVDLFHAVERGDVKALWVMATNPAVSLPDSAQVRRALQACECLVVSDCVSGTDTQAFADIRLPALAWGEKDGTVTNSERCISRQRAFLDPPGEARADWEIVSAVARRLGYPGFEYRSIAEVFDEHARLSAFENDGTRDFDLAGLVGLDEPGYAALQPVQWPVAADGSSSARMFSDGRFFTAGRRAVFVAVTPRPPGQAPGAAFPLVMNTGRVRDHWHTMTRTGKSPRLSAHVGEPFVALNPADAQSLGIDDGAIATVTSAWGEVVVRARVTDAQPVGAVFVPMHWNDQFAAAAGVGHVVNPFVDPVSGQPEFKHTAVRVAAYPASWQGFLLVREPLQLAVASYWSKARRNGLWQYELAGTSVPPGWAGLVRDQFDDTGGRVEWRELHDSTQQHYRAARFVDGTLDAVVVIGPREQLPPRDWLVSLFAKTMLTDADRSHILRGTPARGEQDAGSVVCSCFGVGVNTLRRAIREHGLDSVEALGEVTCAGTNCGSCIPELHRLLAAERVPA